MKKNKGIKIYKQRKKNKGNSNQIFSILGTCAVVLGLGIFGYYVVGLPFVHFLESSKNNQDNESSQVVQSVVTDVKKTEAVTTTKKATTTQAVTTVVSGTTTTSAVTTVSSSATSAQTTIKKQPVSDNGGCFYLSTDDLSSKDALTAKLSTINGFDSVVLPLKVKGGKIYYKSSVQSASLSGAVSSDLDLDTIVKTVEEKGFTPVAEICTITDNIYPVTYKKSAYQFEDGVTGEWLDNKSDQGGKPWMSPFSDITKTYLSDIIDEITRCGIKNVICSGTYFPEFRDKDLGYIGQIVQSDTRYKGLTDLLNLLNTKASANDGKAMIYASASDIVNSTCESFRPEELGTMTAVIYINTSSFPGKSVTDVMNSVKAISGDLKLVPCISSDGLSAENITSAINLLKKDGYDYYMVK